MPTVTGRATDYITFSRASNATVTDSNGYIKWAAHNLLLASEQFDASQWLKTGSATTANSVVAPNGTTTADVISEDTTNNAHAVSQSFNAGAVYTASVFLKYNNLQYVTLSLNNNSVSTEWASAVFDIQNGTLASQNAAIFTIVGTPTITAVGSGWYLCTISANLSAVANGQVYLAAANASTGASFRGAQTYVGSSRSFYAWGAHLYRSDLGGMVLNPARGDAYYPTTPRNLLGFTESLTTGWTNSNTTDSIVTETNPNGLASSVEVTATAGNGTLLGSLSLLASPYTFSIWLKRKTGTGTVEITVDGTTYVTAAVTSDWQRFSTTLTPSAGTRTPGIRLVTSGDAVFAWGAQLSDSASLDAYSPVYGAAVTSAAYYAPRLDYDPVTLAANGLLVEEQRTNAVAYSAELNDTSWAKSEVTVTANAAVSPDGNQTADKVVESTSNTTHIIRRDSISITSGTSYAVSIFAKAAERPRLRIVSYNGSTDIVSIFNLLTGAVVSGSTANIVSVGNGWYRCSHTFTAAATTTTNFACQFQLDNGTTNSYTGDGTSGVYLYGAQLEAGSFATSYIPTLAATATRTADVASVSTQAFPYGVSAGSIVVSGVRFGGAGYGPLVVPRNTATGINDRNPDMSLGAGAGGAAGSARVDAVSGGSVIAPLGNTSGSFVSGTIYKVGYAYATSDYASVVSGGAANTQASGGAPPSGINQVDIGQRNSSAFLNGWIRQITVIPRRLSNSELQARTV